MDFGLSKMSELNCVHMQLVEKNKITIFLFSIEKHNILAATCDQQDLSQQISVICSEKISFPRWKWWIVLLFVDWGYVDSFKAA